MAFSKEAQDIDIKKRALESKYIPKLKKVFNNIADDVSNLLLTTTNINSQEVAENYKPDFIAVLRQLYRDTIRVFGFSLRKQIQSKHNIDFNIQKQITNLQTKQEIEIEEEEEDEINKLFLLAMLLFVNNQSEIQADIITKTNAKEINLNIDKSIAEYNSILANNLVTQQEITQAISSISLSVLFGTATEKDKIKLENEIERLEIQRQKLIKNKTKIVSKGFKDNFKKKGKTRSEVISEFEVGQTESFVREKEAKVLNNVVISKTTLSIKKNWESFGDSRVRESHQIADATYHFKPIPLEQDFFVGGESLSRPRDTRGSAFNIINCRCNSIYKMLN